MEQDVNKRFITCNVKAAALLTTFAVVTQSQTPAPEQKGKGKGVGLYLNQLPAPTGPIVKLPDGTPDLTGTWLGGGGSDADISNPRSLKAGSKVEMLPWAE